MAKLVLVRHAQSIWNLENRFSGWADVPLSKKGIREAKKAGRALENFKFDEVYTSELIRAQLTAFEILDANNNNNHFFRIHDLYRGNYNRFLKKHPELNYTRVFISEALNERDYGNLEGMNKDEARAKWGKEQVHIWRRSYATAPPGGESLKDVTKRTVPYLKKWILKDLKEGKNVLVAAHGNSLRSITKYLEKLSDKEIVSVEIPTGQPIVYNFDEKLNIKSKKVLKE